MSHRSSHYVHLGEEINRPSKTMKRDVSPLSRPASAVDTCIMRNKFDSLSTSIASHQSNSAWQQNDMSQQLIISIVCTEIAFATQIGN